MGEKVLYPPRDATDNFVTDCCVKFADCVTCQYAVGI